MSDTELTKGDSYRIVKSGASLSVATSTGVGSWRVETHDLEPGDIVTYLGRKPGLGHDNIPQDAFRVQGGPSGKFRPDSWGAADTSYLEPVE